jgi:arylsulfatase A-like enzyme
MVSRFLLSILTLTLALPASVSSAAPQAPAEPRLVLLYAPCTLNREYLSPYDPAVDFTPALAAFSRDATVFERNTTESGQSGIAYASLFTGLQAPDHGVWRNPTQLDPSLYTIAEAFRDQGYETFFWAGHRLANNGYGFDQGVAASNVFRLGLRAKHRRFEAILEKLQNDPDYRAFIVTNFSVTHTPYNSEARLVFCSLYPDHCDAAQPSANSLKVYLRIHRDQHRRLSHDFPATVAELKLSDAEVREYAAAMEMLYKANVRRLDELFGSVLHRIREAGLYDESLIAFTADHGESLFRDNTLFKWGHGFELRPEVLTTPLIVRAPKGAQGVARYTGVSRSIDVFPTLLGLAGAGTSAAETSERPEPKGPQGVDLSATMAGREPPPDLLAHSHTAIQHDRTAATTNRMSLWLKYHKGVNVSEPWVSVREGDLVYKYRNIDGKRWGFQLFDLGKDAAEREDIFDGQQPRHRQFQRTLTAYRELLMQGWAADQKRIDVTVPPPNDHTLRALESLGYVIPEP